MANVFNKPEIEFGKLDIRDLFINSILTLSELQF